MRLGTWWVPSPNNVKASYDFETRFARMLRLFFDPARRIAFPMTKARPIFKLSPARYSERMETRIFVDLAPVYRPSGGPPVSRTDSVRLRFADIAKPLL